MPRTIYDPGLLREQETPLVKGKNWFLDQMIPGGGNVRIQLVAGMGKASGRNENHHDGRSDYMPGPRTKMDNHQRGIELSKKAGVLGRLRQALITTIQKETKQTEELEEAGYRSPTWSVLRVL